MSIQESNIAIDEITDAAVADYLRENPGFFTSHTSLLGKLEIPHPTKGAVSLIEYQVKVLREKNERLNKKLKEMFGAARGNDKLNDRMFHLAGALIRVTSLDDTLLVIEESMYDDFEADAVAIKFFDPRNIAPESCKEYVIKKDEPRMATFENLFRAKRPLCGQLKPSQLDYLFAKQAKHIHSTALIPIGRKCEYGFVAIGSRDRKRFIPSKDITFLLHLSELLGSALQGKV